MINTEGLIDILHIKADKATMQVIKAKCYKPLVGIVKDPDIDQWNIWLKLNDRKKTREQQPFVTIDTEEHGRALESVINFNSKNGESETLITRWLNNPVAEVATVEVPVPAPVAKKPTPEYRPSPARNGYEEDIPLPEYVPEENAEEEKEKPVIFHYGLFGAAPY